MPEENGACTRGEILSRRSLSLHGHGDERWPTEVTPNTYFRGVDLVRSISKSIASVRFQVVDVPSGGALLDEIKRNDMFPGYRLESYPNRNSVEYSQLYGIDSAHTLIRGTLRYEVLDYAKFSTPQTHRMLTFAAFLVLLSFVFLAVLPRCCFSGLTLLAAILLRPEVFALLDWHLWYFTRANGI